MNYILKSLPAMILLSAAAIFLTLSEAFNVAAYASLTPSSLGVSDGLSRAGDWLTFAAIVIGLLALGTAAWATVLAKNWAAVAEIGVGIVGGIIIAVGDLINAATSENSASTANILQAIGFGILTLLVSAMRAAFPGRTGCLPLARVKRRCGSLPRPRLLLSLSVSA